jgi:hypothetical protein
MNEQPLKQKRRLLALLIVLLVAGFLTTSLVSYFVSVALLREHIISNALPLTSDTVYSEIQRDLLRPVFISSVMANDTFLKDWILAGEADHELISKYLSEIKSKYRTSTSFLVSAKTHNYYLGDGVLKAVSPGDPRDAWYFRVRDMKNLYETNVDPDMGNRDAPTVFVNHKIYDHDGSFIGATGVGLTIDSMSVLMELYSRKYQRGIYFVDRAGEIVLRSAVVDAEAGNIRDMQGMAEVADALLSDKEASFQVQRAGGSVHLRTRFISELQWTLVVEQAEQPMMKRILDALLMNLALCAVITSLVIGLTYLSIGVYQKRINRMFEAEQKLRQMSVEQNDEIVRKNVELEAALADIRQLSGLLPLCASCKKVRDDDGYWRQIESYVQQHSEAQFSHSLCPDCVRKLYPDLADEVNEGDVQIDENAPQ